MEEIGVSLLVQGLSSFMGDMKKADSAIQGLVPGGNLLSGMFSKLGDVISGFVGGALQVLEYTLGNLASDAIEAVISAIKEMITQIIEAGNEFQTLSIRLNGMNLPKSANDVKDWSAAMGEASKATQEQLTWIQMLATATPFNTTDIAQAYALARSYGYTDEEARRLTKDVTNFSSAMGLTSESVVNTMQNFGQMEQRGKIMGYAIRNLTRSAYLPLDDVLNRLATDMGITKEALEKQISTAEGVPADLFIKAFEAMVEEEPRFIGAAGRLGRTFQAAGNNIVDLFRNIGGLNVVKPILDVLGEKMASIIDQFVSFNDKGDMIKTANWDRLVAAATSLGKSLSGILTKLLGLLPNSESFVDALISGLENVSKWLDAHSDDIVAWVQNAAGWIKNTLVPAIGTLIEWLGQILTPSAGQQGGPLQSLAEGAKNAAYWIGGVLIPFVQNSLMPLLSALGPLAVAILRVFIMAITGSSDTVAGLGDFINGTLIPAIQNLTTWIDDNRGTLAKWVRAIAVIIAIFAVAGAIVSTFINIVIGIGTAIAAAVTIGVASVIALGAAFLTFYTVTRANLTTWAGALEIVMVAALRKLQIKISDWAAGALATFASWVNNVINIINQLAGIHIPTIVIPVSYEITGGGGGGGGGNGTCFIGGTLVTLSDGNTKPIEEIVVGDEILSWDTIGNLPVTALVSVVLHHQPEESPFYILINDTLGVTPEHQMFMDGKWKLAGLIEIGDNFLGEDGNPVLVENVQYVYGEVATYNLHTDHGTHNYFANGVLVHNSVTKAMGTKGWQTVPAGFPNDTYQVMMSSGEQFAVIPKGQPAMAAQPAMNTVNSSQQIINNLTLQINSSAKTEPIIQDFGLMKSMVGQS